MIACKLRVCCSSGLVLHTCLPSALSNHLLGQCLARSCMRACSQATCLRHCSLPDSQALWQTGFWDSRWLEAWRDLRELQSGGAFAQLNKEAMLAELCRALLRGGHFSLAQSYLLVRV